MPMLEIRAQAGPQEQALALEADITIFGGAAGGGKSWGLLLAVVQHAHLSRFGAEIFRRTYPELTMTGGLWPESYRIFRPLGAEPKETTLEWSFPSGARCKFSHMQHAKDRFNWDGAQVPMLGFDQLESFEEIMVWYLLSRNRDPSGQILPFLFGTCNPVPEDDKTGGWLHRLIQWWVDPETGLAIEERSGAIRWLVRRDDDSVDWAGTREELLVRHPGSDPKSFTFIRSLLDDNPALTKADPGYRGRLMLLPAYERQRKLGANWNAKPSAGNVFDRSWFSVADASPAEARRVRSWDKAGTEGAGDWSVGVRIAETDGTYYVEDVVRGQWSSMQRNRVMRQTAEADGEDVRVVVEQEPGSGGKESAEITVRDLAGYDIRAYPATGDIVTRAGAYSAQAEAGNVRLVRGPWNEDFLREHHAFPESGHDDQVSAAAQGFNRLALGARDVSVTTSGAERRPAPQRVTLSG